jgi:organic radical activating enzyme
MKVNEIFYSLQGEGRYTGTAAVFLRLSGCNTRCPFCDTDHQSGKQMTEREILQTISHYPTRHIVITGGEPTMQLTASFTQMLHEAGYFTQIETNGSLPLPEGCEIDWITCSPKNLPIKIQRIDEVKVLFDIADKDNTERISRYGNIKAKEYRLQPLDASMTLEGDALTEQNKRNLEATIQFILDNPKWKLSLQTHKIINVR